MQGPAEGQPGETGQVRPPHPHLGAGCAQLQPTFACGTEDPVGPKVSLLPENLKVSGVCTRPSGFFNVAKGESTLSDTVGATLASGPPAGAVARKWGPGFEPRAPHFLTVWSWTRCLLPLGLKWRESCLPHTLAVAETNA